jgi:methanethiol S-methyltransferase
LESVLIIEGAATLREAPREGLPMAIIVGFIYLAFSAALLYAVLFVGNLGAPRTIDLGPAAPPLQAWVIDGTLLALFALLDAALTHVQSSEPGRRSGAGYSAHAHALIASLVLTALFIAWRPLPQIIWSLSGAPANVLRVLFYLGWTLVLISAFVYHGRLFAAPGAAIASRGPGTDARGMGEPMYPGLMLALWAAPVMTAGHLLLAASATAYVLAAALLEERSSLGIARGSSSLKRPAKILPRATARPSRGRL